MLYKIYMLQNMGYQKPISQMHIVDVVEKGRGDDANISEWNGPWYMLASGADDRCMLILITIKYLPIVTRADDVRL